LRRLRIEAALKNLDSGPAVMKSTFREHEVEKLRAEGPKALPILTRKLPGLRGIAASTAADLLGAARYEPAVPALLSALESNPSPSLWSIILSIDPKEHVQKALLNMARGAHVPQIVEKLFDPRTSNSHGSLIALLAKIDSPEAFSAIRRFYDKDPYPRRLWWSPPDPSFYLKNSDCSDATAAASVQERLEAILCAPDSMLVPRPDGGVMILFVDDFLGGKTDLWAAGLNGETFSQAVFLGALDFGPEADRINFADVEAVFEGPLLAVRRNELPQVVMRFDPMMAALDTDGDSLPDLVEERFGLDPRQADSDGDGFNDAEDATPTGGVRRPRSDEEEIVLAIARHVSPTAMTGDEKGRPPVLPIDLAFAWARVHPLISRVDAAEPSVETLAGAALGIYLRSDRGEGAAEDALSSDPDERHYSRIESRGCIGHRVGSVVVRRYRGLWIVTQF
jgi:hypothetical protein